MIRRRKREWEFFFVRRRGRESFLERRRGITKDFLDIEINNRRRFNGCVGE